MPKYSTISCRGLCSAWKKRRAGAAVGIILECLFSFFVMDPILFCQFFWEIILKDKTIGHRLRLSTFISVCWL